MAVIVHHAAAAAKALRTRCNLSSKIHARLLNFHFGAIILHPVI
jgi:hypothetical protein